MRDAASSPARIPVSRAALASLGAEDAGKITLGFRPESLDVVSQAEASAFPVEVNIVEELGSDAFVYGTLRGSLADADLHSGAGDNQIIIRIDPRNVPAKGERIYVAIRPGEEHLFAAGSGLRLPN